MNRDTLSQSMPFSRAICCGDLPALSRTKAANCWLDRIIWSKAPCGFPLAA